MNNKFQRQLSDNSSTESKFQTIKNENIVLEKKDNCKMEFDSIFSKLTEPDEVIVYSEEVVETLPNGYKKSMIYVLTNRFQYNIRFNSTFNNMVSFFCNCWKIKNRIPQVEIEMILYCYKSDSFCLSSPGHIDLYYSSEIKNELIDYQYFARKEANCNIELIFSSKSDDYIVDYIKKFKKNDSDANSKRCTDDLIKVNHEDFGINFLGRKLTSSDLVGTDSRIRLTDFEFKNHLAEGGFSKVYLVKQRKTKELFAIKAIRMPHGSKDNLEHKQQIQHERDILVKIDHPFIVKLKYAFQSTDRFWLVMSFVQGGEILKHMKAIGKKNREEIVKFYAFQIADVQIYLHSKGIVYGDLKPENILQDKYGYVKLTDFGASKMLHGKNSVLGFAGTQDYLAPEVFKNKKITKMTDWWTFGVLIYEMLYEKNPFEAKVKEETFKKIYKAEVNFPDNDKISSDAVKLISNLLQKYRKNRIGYKNEQDILDHPWFSSQNFENIRKTRESAPIQPHIETEASVENFNKNITDCPLKLSFDLKDKFISEIPDEGSNDSFDDDIEKYHFIEQNVVNTPYMESFASMNPSKPILSQELENIEERYEDSNYSGLSYEIDTSNEEFIKHNSNPKSRLNSLDF